MYNNNYHEEAELENSKLIPARAQNMSSDERDNFIFCRPNVNKTFTFAYIN